MRIIALVKSPRRCGGRCRLAAIRPYMDAAGHQLGFRPWSGRWWSRLWLRRDVGPADVIILQRKLAPPWQLALLRQAARFLLFDFDDAVFIRDSYSLKATHCPSRAQGFAGVVRAAHAVVAGNRFLHDHAALWTSPERIHLVPTCLDPGRYSLAEHRNKKGAQLVWIGSSSTLRGMERIQPLLEKLGKRQPGLEWKIICDRFLKLKSMPVLRCPWSQAREGAELAGADIGISWLPDDLWSQGKCGLKILQYMAAGLPVVADPVGMQASLVSDGDTRFLARTPEEWHHAVARLAADAGLRKRLGQAGRAFVEAHYNVPSAADRWLALLENLETVGCVPFLGQEVPVNEQIARWPEKGTHPT